MKQLPKVVLFDMDGTILDNSDAVVDAYHRALKLYNYPPKDKEYIASLAGLSTYNTARKLGVKEEDLNKIDEYFWQYFHKYADDPNRISTVFDYVLEVLNFLKNKNIKMGIVTSNESKIAKKLFKKVNLIDFFEIFIGSEDVTERKPSAEPILLALQRMQIKNINSKTVWYIGDSESDVFASKNANITSISLPLIHTLKTVTMAEPNYLLKNMKSFYNKLILLK